MAIVLLMSSEFRRERLLTLRLGITHVNSCDFLGHTRPIRIQLPVGTTAVIIAKAILLGAQAADQRQPRRVALVIGNSSYQTAPLRNPKSDAEAITKSLESVGFEVTMRLDRTKQQIEDDIDDTSPIRSPPIIRAGWK